MKMRLFLTLVTTLSCLAIAASYNTTASFDGINPAHAVDANGKAIPDCSATQPAAPLTLSKDSKDPKWGELKPEAAFDHTKHNTDVMHTLDGKTLTACVECHHTEQPAAPSGKPYLKRFNRNEVLTAPQLATSKSPVNSCRVCHYQPTTPKTNDYPPKISKEIARLMEESESDRLTNDKVYHFRCISCHDAAKTRDKQLKAPTGCPDCHVNKLAPATTTPSPRTSPTTIPTPRNSPSATPTSSPTP